MTRYELLENIAEFYDGQVKAAVKSLTSFVQPWLMMLMSLVRLARLRASLSPGYRDRSAAGA